MIEPLISVIIPTYNVEDFIAESIVSVIQQSYRNWELIVVDDGSTDDTLRIAKSYAARNSKQIFVFRRAHKGVSAARNFGLTIARGNYVYFMDSDDTVVSSGLEDMINIAYPNDLDVLLFNANVFSDDKSMTARVNEYQAYYDRHVDTLQIMSGIDALNHMLDYSFSPSVPLQFFSADILRNTSFVEGIVYEDNPFTVSVLSQANNVGICNERFYNRRIRSGSIMNTKRPDCIKQYISYITVAESLRQTSMQIEDRVVRSKLSKFATVFVQKALYFYMKLNSEQKNNLPILLSDALMSIDQVYISCFASELSLLQQDNISTNQNGGGEKNEISSLHRLKHLLGTLVKHIVGR